MAHTFVPDSIVSTRLTGRPLRIARLAWLLILLLAVGKLALGLPSFYAEKAQVCTTAVEACSRTESPNSSQAEALGAVGVSLPTYARIATAASFFHLLIWAGVGVLIFLLRPDDWLALVASAMMISFTTGQYTDPIARAYPGLALPSQFIFDLQNVLLFLFFGLFPSGRFVPRWMRWYWLAMCVVSLAPRIPDFAVAPFWLSFLTLGPFSQIYRYRKSSTPVERQQTKWVVFGFAVMAGLILLQFLRVLVFPGDDGLSTLIIDDFYFDLAALFIPLSIGVSILRYRLFDIDVIIRKTLVYAVLTALLALVYFGSVVLLQRLFDALTGVEQSPLAVVVSTLAIAALFTPLRRRIQDGIDRRFFRKKYDAQQVLAQFALTARDEVSLEALTAELTRVVQETMQPEKVSLWLQPTEKPRR
ncbi:MAG: hypothetical protein WBE17_07715, partial [Anaerolineae bacterium]